MTKRTPIKRHESLQPLSRQHHSGLLFCWKIRTGFAKNIPADRMKVYAEWFFQNHLLPHFAVEEQYVFPLLGNENPLVKRALADHRRLARLFNSSEKPEKTLGQIEEELDAHIRFEERVLFNEIQNAVSPDVLTATEALHHQELAEAACWTDEFWENK